MDPFMEMRWHDVHNTLASHARDQLNVALVPLGLRAHTQERLVIDDPDDHDHAGGDHIYPDVAAVDTGGGTAVAVAPPVAVATPLRFASEPSRELYVEIRSRRGGDVVTMIEFVSPTNKRPGDGRRQFLHKRDQAAAAGVNLVEIDLTRAGQRPLPQTIAASAQASQAAYFALVHRHHPERAWEAYPIPLRQPLPNLAIPLRATDADVPLMLQPLIDLCHKGAVFDELDYRQPLDPPLPNDDAAWAADRLRAAGV
jgi:hypothetical protein